MSEKVGILLLLNYFYMLFSCFGSQNFAIFGIINL
jgi:hypothetical protein